MTAIPRQFLDASVLIAASGSRTGASALVLTICRHRRAKAVSSRLVLLEAERNVRSKLGEGALLRFYQEIATLDLDLVEAPTDQEIAAQSRIIDPKDAHVLAAPSLPVSACAPGGSPVPDRDAGEFPPGPRALIGRVLMHRLALRRPGPGRTVLLGTHGPRDPARLRTGHRVPLAGR